MVLQRNLIKFLRTELGEQAGAASLPTKDGDRLIFKTPYGTVAWDMQGVFNKEGVFSPAGLVHHFHSNGQLKQEYKMNNGY